MVICSPRSILIYLRLIRPRRNPRKFQEAYGRPNYLQCALADTWHINNRVNLRLLDALTDEQLAATILPRGKAVTSYFVHIHMARILLAGAPRARLWQRA